MAITLPSKSNTYGSLAGLVAGFVTAKLTTAGIIATIATFAGVPELTVLSLLSIVVASAVNYGVTHVSELKSIDDVVAALPKTYPEYPDDKKGAATPNNLQK